MLTAFLCVLGLAGAALQGSEAEAARAAGQPTLIVLNKSEATASLIELESGKIVKTLPVGKGPHEAATSPDGKTVVVCNYGEQTPGSSLTVLDMLSREVDRTIELVDYHRPHGIVFISEHELLVTAEVEKKLILVDLRSDKVEAAMHTDQGASHMVAVSPDHQRAFVANIASGSISVIDLESKELVKVIPTGAGAEGIAVHPTKPEVWVTNRSADSVSVIDTKTLEPLAQMGCAAFPIRVAFTPDGRHALVSCAKSGDVAVFDVAQRELSQRIRMDEKALEDSGERLFGDSFGNSPVPIGILVEPEGKLAFIANTNADIVTVIDTTSWKIVRRLATGKQPDGMSWTSVAASAGAAAR